MAWNLGLSALICGSSLTIFDGDAFFPTQSDYWRRVARERVTYLGLSAAFIMQSRSENVVPKELANLSALRTVISDGSRLTADGWRWVYDCVNEGVYLASNAGGTELAGSVIGGVRLRAVRVGEMSCRYLGAEVLAYDEEGRAVYDRQGEMVITRPIPSMALGLLDGEGGIGSRETYFRRFAGVWCQGDWLTVSHDGYCVISGRSDATLNRGGVRLGTGEFYPVVEGAPGIVDSLVVHLEDSAGGIGELVLFLKLAPDAVWDAALLAEVRRRLSSELSPRHVPDRILAVSQIPRSPNGKKLEVPVKRILGGTTIDEVVDSSAMTITEVLEEFQRYRSGVATVPRTQLAE